MSNEVRRVMPKSVTNPYQCVGKVQHRSKVAAEKAREGCASRKGFKNGRGLRAYKCGTCGFWHIGSTQR
jgi:hypothetical protein